MRSVRVTSGTELFGAYEVFATDDYTIDLAGVHRVLDLGANVGFASMLLAERYPEAEIIAVEAAPDTFARLVENVVGLRLRALHLAVGHDGPVHIDLRLPSAERQISSSGVEVHGASLSTLLDTLGWDSVDLMKIDIEGAELEVFADPAMANVRAIVGEVHGDLAAIELLSGYTVETTPAVGGSATMFRALAP